MIMSDVAQDKQKPKIRKTALSAHIKQVVAKQCESNDFKKICYVLADERGDFSEKGRRFPAVLSANRAGKNVFRRKNRAPERPRRSRDKRPVALITATSYRREKYVTV